MKKLYVKCTTDKYELPIAVADNPGELANMLGVTTGTVRSSTSKRKNGYYKVEVEDFILPVCYPDNDGNLWYRDYRTGKTVYVRE